MTGAFWSAENTDGAGARAAGSDQRMLAAVGPFRLAPGQADTLTVAVVFAETDDRLAAVTQLRAVAAALHNAYRTTGFQPERVVAASAPAVDRVLRLGEAQPNPVVGRADVPFAVPAGTWMRATVYDPLGREVAVLHDGASDAEGRLPIDARRLSAGVYRLRVQVSGGEAWRTFAVVR